MAMSGSGLRLLKSYKQFIPKGDIRPHWSSGPSDFIGSRPDDTAPVLYLSGTSGSKVWDEAEFKKTTGCMYRCFSYAYTGPDSFLRAMRHVRAMNFCLKNGVHVMMDSGAHSFHNFRYYSKGSFRTMSKTDRNRAIDELISSFKDKYVDYIKWCYSKGKFFDFHITFDAEKRCQMIWDVTHELFKKGIRSVPVYHGDDSLDFVRRYIDEGHKLIGVGISRIGKSNPDAVRRYYDNVISLCYKHKVGCHGFAMTGDLMFQFPWHSVDSTTWLKASAYGKIIDIMPEKQRVALIHVSNQALSQGYGAVEGLSKGVQRYLRDKVEAVGFDYDKVRVNIPYRAMYNAKVLIKAVAAHTRCAPQWQVWESVI